MVTDGYMGRREHMCRVYYEMFYVKGLRAARACAARHAKQKSSTASTFFWISVPKFCAQYCKVGRGQKKKTDRILTFTQDCSRQWGGCCNDFSHCLELQSMMATTKCLWKCCECVIISWKILWHEKAHEIGPKLQLPRNYSTEFLHWYKNVSKKSIRERAYTERYLLAHRWWR